MKNQNNNSKLKNSLVASIIVVVYKDNRLDRLLESLTKQTIERESYEIIVIENGSEILRQICKNYNVSYYNIKKKNMASARNLGLEQALSDLVLFIDVDCVAERNWIKNIVTYFNLHHDSSGIGGKIERFKPITLVERFGSNLVNGQKELNFLPIINLPYVALANAGFRKKVLMEVEGFDERLLSGNDVDICYKIGLKGYKLSICLDAIVYHQNRRRIYDLYVRFFNYAVYHCLLFKKYKLISRKKIVLNMYPLCCFKKAFKLQIESLVSFKRYKENFWISFFLVIEGLGVFFGNLYGSLKFRTFYL